MIDENEFYRMRSLLEDEQYKRGELEYILSEVQFLVESDTSKNETIAKIKEILEESPVQFSIRRNLF